MYKALINFVDLQDNNHRYHAGDEFPRNGMEVSPERIDELLTDKNRRHKPVIEKVEVVVPEPTAKADEKPAEKPKKGGKKKTDAK